MNTESSVCVGYNDCVSTCVCNELAVTVKNGSSINNTNTGTHNTTGTPTTTIRNGNGNSANKGIGTNPLRVSETIWNILVAVFIVVILLILLVIVLIFRIKKRDKLIQQVNKQNSNLNVNVNGNINDSMQNAALRMSNDKGVVSRQKTNEANEGVTARVKSDSRYKFEQEGVPVNFNADNLKMKVTRGSHATNTCTAHADRVSTVTGKASIDHDIDNHDVHENSTDSTASSIGSEMYQVNDHATSAPNHGPSIRALPSLSPVSLGAT